MTKQQRENRAKGLCGNGLHAWVEGQNQCMDCLREARRRWYEANTKKHREGIRRWREANPEKVQEANRRWYEANGEEERERNRRWRELNPEEDRERNRRWRDANPEKKREAEHRRRARLKGNGAYAVSDKDMRRLQQQQCAHAHLSPCNGPMHVDHVIPVARGGSHGIGNLQRLCQRHNISKHARLEVEIRRRARSRAP